MWGSFRRKTGHIFCLERADCSKSLNGEEIQKKNSVMTQKDNYDLKRTLHYVIDINSV